MYGRHWIGRGVGWAGKIKTGDGRLVYDSVANNSAAHYLFNMLYLAGENGEAAKPGKIKAELLRGNEIENFDACKIDFVLPCDAKCSFIAAHPVKKEIEPLFIYKFEKGAVYYSFQKTAESVRIMPDEYNEYGEIVTIFDDGRKKIYGDPMAESLNKLHEAVRAVKTGYSEIETCGISATAVHTKMINYIQKNFEIYNISPSLLKEENGLLYAEGLFEKMVECFNDMGMTLDGFYEKKQ